jgi:hypothetical protein
MFFSCHLFQCSGDNTGCKWISNSANHDRDRCVDLDPSALLSLAQERAKITSKVDYRQEQLKRHDKFMEAFAKATQQLMGEEQRKD